MRGGFPDVYRSAAQVGLIEMIATSYARLLSRPLVEEGTDIVDALWEAPLAIVAHGTEPDPLFFFANRAALEAFDTDSDCFIGMPSRLSAEELLREERQALLDRVSAVGYIDDYSGIRISAKGRRFLIRDAVVWNLVDKEGAIHGQAACFAP